MTATPADRLPAGTAAAGTPPRASALDWLSPLGFSGGLTVTLAALVLSFVAFGWFLPYWRVADQDIFLAYQGMLAAGGLPQEYFDHTGYLAYLTLGWWYDLLHALGLLPVHMIAELPPTAARGAYEAAWTDLVRAGRALSFLLAAGFVSLSAVLLRRLSGDWRAAVIAAFVLAFSAGVAWHMRIIRTELISGGLLALGAMVLLVAVREPQNRGRPLLVGAAAFLVALAIVAKVQALVPALALPVLALLWARPPTKAVPRRRIAWPGAAVLALLAAAAAAPAASLLTGAANDPGGALFVYTPVFAWAPGLYQIVLVLWFAAGAAVFALLNRVSPGEAAATAAAIILGVALAILTLAIRYHPQNALALLHPVEHMFQFATWSHPELAGDTVLSGNLVSRILGGIGQVLAVRTLVLLPTFRPTLIVEWFLIAAAVYLWVRRDRRLALAIAGTLALVWGIDAVFTLRHLKIEYAIYSDPLAIAAAAVALPALPPPGRRAGVIAAGLIFVMVIISQIEPEKLLFDPGDPASNCSAFPVYTPRLEPFPFCQQLA